MKPPFNRGATATVCPTFSCGKTIDESSRTGNQNRALDLADVEEDGVFAAYSRRDNPLFESEQSRGDLGVLQFPVGEEHRDSPWRRLIDDSLDPRVAFDQRSILNCRCGIVSSGQSHALQANANCRGDLRPIQGDRLAKGGGHHLEERKDVHRDRFLTTHGGRYDGAPSRQRVHQRWPIHLMQAWIGNRPPRQRADRRGQLETASQIEVCLRRRASPICRAKRLMTFMTRWSVGALRG